MICSLVLLKSAGEIFKCFLNAVAKLEEEYPMSPLIYVMLLSLSTFSLQALLSRRTRLIN